MRPEEEYAVMPENAFLQEKNTLIGFLSI